MSGMPHSFGVEQSLLGALIFDNQQIDLVSDKLSEASFFAEQHITVWRALEQIRLKGGIADANTLLEFFERENQLKKIGGEEYLAQMVNNAALEPELEEYTEILIDLQHRRAMIRIGQVLESSSVKPEIGQNSSDIAIAAQTELSAIMMGTTVKPATNVKAGMKTYVQKVRDGMKGETEPCLSSGSEILNKRLGGGFYPSDLIILAGRPSMGKTQAALSFLEGMASNGSLKTEGRKALVPFFSLEMDEDSVFGRMMTANSHKRFGKRYSSRKMRSYEIPEKQLDALEQHIEELSDSMLIDDQGGIRIKDIEIRCLNIERTHGRPIDAIVVDYLQIMAGAPDDIKGGKTAEITGISAGLKRIAKKFNVPVIALAQLSRAVESRDDKRPQLSDLRDSGAIEQDADVVIFVYREAYYHERSEPDPSSDKHQAWSVKLEKIRNVMSLITAKQRHGPVGSDDVYCDVFTGYVGDVSPTDMHGSAAHNDPRWNGQS